MRAILVGLMLVGCMAPTREVLSCSGTSAGAPVCYEIDVTDAPVDSPYRDCRIVGASPVVACDTSSAAGECLLPNMQPDGPPSYTVIAPGQDAASASADCADLGGTWVST